MVENARQFVFFRIGNEEYGLPIEQVASIIRYEKATPVPRAPEFVEGVINLRGMVIPVLDLHARFSGSPRGQGEEFQRIVVAEGESGSVGIAVDAASEVATVAADAIRPAPEAALSADTFEAFEGVVDIDDRLIILLRLDKAVPHADYASVSAAQEGEADV